MYMARASAPSHYSNDYATEGNPQRPGARGFRRGDAAIGRTTFGLAGYSESSRRIRPTSTSRRVPTSRRATAAR